MYIMKTKLLHKFIGTLLVFLVSSTFLVAQTTMALFQFNNNTNPDPGAIGSPTLTTYAGSWDYSSIHSGNPIPAYYTDNNGDLRIVISTTGYTNIQISWDASRYLCIWGCSNPTFVLTGDPAGGTTWGSTLHTQTIPGTSWYSTGWITLGAAYDNQALISLRIDGTDGNWYQYIDNISIRGTLASTPPTAGPITGAYPYLCGASTFTNVNGNPADGLPPFLHAWTQSGAGSVSFSAAGNQNTNVTGLTAGSVTITYTVTDANLATATATYDIEVLDCGGAVNLVNNYLPTDPCACNNDQTANGSQDGSFAETASVTGTLAGETWTVTGITSLSGGAILPTGIAVGDPLVWDGVNAHRITFTHYDDAGYDLDVEGPNAVGTPGNVTFTITNLCEYPVAAFLPAIAPGYAVADPPQLLNLVELNANPGTDAFTIDLAAATQIDPGVLAIGGHTVEGTFTGTFVDDQFGTVANPAYPGCITTVDANFTVYSSVPVADAGDDQNLCFLTGTTLTGFDPNPPAGWSKTITWSLFSTTDPNGAIISNPSSAVTNITFGDGIVWPPAGDYTYTFEIEVEFTDGVTTNTVTDQVVVTNYRPAPPANAGPDIDLCYVGAPVSTNMAAIPVAYGAGVWSCIADPGTAPTITTPASATTNVDFSVPGSYTMRWTTSNSVYCVENYADMVVYVWEQPVITGVTMTSPWPNPGADPYEICLGTLNATFATTYTGDVSGFLWQSFGDGTFTTPFNDNTTYNIGILDQILQEATITFSVNGVAPCASDNFTFRLFYDETPPVPSCNNLTLPLDATGNASIVWNDIEDGGSTDNCTPYSDYVGPFPGGVIYFDASPSTFTCADIDFTGGIFNPMNVTLYAEDENFNNATCISQVTVIDNLAPTATDPDPVNVQCIADIPAPDITVVDDEADNCDPAPVVAWVGDVNNGATGCPGDAYVVTRTYSVTDLYGNSMTVTQTLTALDDTPPTATDPDPVDVQCIVDIPAPDITVVDDEADNCTAAPVVAHVGDTDNGGLGCPSSPYIVTREYSVTDDCGNSISVYQTLTAVDNTNPTFTVPGTFTVYTDALCNYDASSAITGVPTFVSDNCDLAPTVSESDVIDPGTCPGEYIITRTWKVEDFCGNFLEQDQIIYVEDNTPPTFTAPLDAVIYKDDFCLADILPSNPLVGDVTDEADNCTPVLDATYSDVPFPDFFCTGSDLYIRTWSLVDDCGNAAADQVQFIEVLDNTAPYWLTPVGSLDADVSCDDPGALAAAQALFPTAADNCDPDVTNIVLVTDIYTADPVCTYTGVYYREWEVTDDCGNTSVLFAQTITVYDNTNPYWTTLAGALDVTLDCADAAGLAAAYLLFPTAADNCDPAPFVGYNGEDIYPLSCPGSWLIARQWVATDLCGNWNNYFQFITITDLIAPTWVTPAGDLDRTVDCDDPGAYAAAQLLFPVAIDNCDPDVTNIVKVSGPFVANPGCTWTGTYTNTWTVTDWCDNTSLVYTQVITVVDNDPPVWTTGAGDLDISVSCDDPGALAAAQALFPVASDNCDLDVTNIVKVPGTLVPGACLWAGTITNTWTVTDDCGNVSAVYTQVITVYDNAAPTWTTPAGDLDRTLSCEDAGGLTTAQALFPAATDNCDPDVTDIVKISGPFVPSGCPFSGTYTNTWTVYDDCGNLSGVYTQVITITDLILPTAVCQNHTVYLDAAGTATMVAADIDGGSFDNCGTVSLSASQTSFDCADMPSVTVTLTVTDECGNFSQCDATVFVVDDLPPTALCQNVTIYLDASGTASTTAADVNDGSFDNCTAPANLILSLDQTDFTCADIGPNPVTLSVEDESGNVGTCGATVTVVDAIPPTITCPADVLMCLLPGVPSTTVSGLDPVIWDNCSYVLTYSLAGASGPGGGIGSVSDVVSFLPGLTIVTYTVTDAGGNVVNCDFRVNVINIANPDGGENQNLCELSTATLIGNPSALPPGISIVSVNWSYVGPSVPAGAPAPILNPASGASNVNVFFTNIPPDDDYTYNFLYEVVYTDGFATCTGSDAVFIKNWRAPFIPNAGPDQDICHNAPVVSTFMAAIPVDYGLGTWSNVTYPAGHMASIVDPTDPFTQVLFDYPGVYEFNWTTTNSIYCPPSNASMLIYVWDPPVASIPSGDIELCLTQTAVPLVGTWTGDAAGFQWQKSPGADGTFANPFDPVTIYYMGPNDYLTQEVFLTFSVQGVAPCGNSQATIRVFYDETPPVISSCAPDANININSTLYSCEATIPDLTGLVIATDNCTNFTVTQDPIAGSLYATSHNGLIPVTLTVTDDNGNWDDCITTLTAKDVTPPVWLTAAGTLDRTLSCSDLIGLADAQALEPVVGDNCDAAPVITKIAGAFVPGPLCDQAGTYTNTFTAQDAAGNVSAIYTQVITIYDNEAPTWLTAAGDLDVSVSCDDLPGLALAQGFFPVADDNCDADVTDIVKNAGAFVPGLCPQAGTYTNTWTVADDCGNVSAVYTQVITIYDNTAPVWLTATGALDVSLSCDDLSGLAAAQLLFPEASDNCDGDVSNIVKSAGAFVPGVLCPQAGTYTNTWTVTDDCGNTSGVYTQVITIYDNTAPVWLTATGALNVSVSCDDPGALAAAQALYPVANDNCDGDVTDIVKVAGTFVAGPLCPEAGTITNTWTVADDCGNVSAVYTQVITVYDNTAPTWTTTAGALDMILSCDDVAGLAAAQALMPEAMDNCDIDPVVSKVAGPFVPGASCAQAGTYTNTFTAVDDCGNVSTVFTQIITIYDNTKPYWTYFPADITINCDEPLPAPASPTAADNCDPAPFVGYAGQVIVPGACPNEYYVVREWNAVDACGNYENGYQQIHVVDVTAPTWTTAAGALDATVSCEDAGALATAQALFPIAADNCDADVSDIVKNAGSYVPGALCSQGGTITNTWTVTDDCGNVSNVFTQVITITDNIAPVWTTLAGDLDISLSCEDASGLAAAQALMPAADDNCDVDPVVSKTAGAFVAGSCPQAGTYTNTFTAIDDCGNVSAVFTQVITIYDNTAPVWTNVAGDLDVTVSCSDAGALATAQAMEPMATDLCDLTLTPVKVAGPFVPGVYCPQEGTYTNTWTVTDDCGNVSNVFTQVITVEDNNAPTAACQNITIYLDATGYASIAAADVDNGSYDDCGAVNLSVSPWEFTCANVGPNAVVLTVTDLCGNVSQCDATVTVVDNMLPVAICMDATVYLDANGQAGITVLDVDNGSWDNCGIANMTVAPDAFTCANIGANTVVLTVTDVNGNVATCAAVVTVLDNTPPSLACPYDQIVCSLPGFSYTPVANIDPVITDNCSYTYGYTLSGATTVPPAGFGSASDVVNFNVGVTTVTYWVLDEGGNFVDCSFTVDVHQFQYADAGPDQEWCNNENAYLLGNFANPGYIPTWAQVSGPPAVIFQVDNEAIVDDLIPGETYVFSYTLDDGICNHTDYMTLTNWAPPTPALAGFDQELCNVASFQLDANVPAVGTGSWTLLSGPNVPTFNPADPAAVVTNIVTGQYGFIWTIENGVCPPNSDEVLITNYPMVVVNAGPNDIVCPNFGEYTIAGASATDQYSLFWSASGTGYFNNVTTVNPTYYFSPADILAGQVTLTLTGYGLGPCPSAQSQMVLTIDDFENPVIATCPADMDVNLDADCGLLVPDMTGDLVATDNCVVFAIAQDPPAGTVLASAHNMVHTVIFTVTDLVGNAVTCSAELTGIDVDAPVIVTCPAPRNVDLNGTCQVIVPDLLVDLVAEDNCTWTAVQNPAAGTALASSHNATHNVTITVTDGAGLTDVCTVVLTAKDVTAPVISVCAPNQNINLGANCSFVVPNLLPAVTASDNCTFALSQSPVAGTTISSGHNFTHNVTITATDAAGNFATCVAVLTAKDVTPPSFLTCAIGVTRNSDPGQCGAVVNYPLPTFTDNCIGATMTLISGYAPGSFFPVGVTPVLYRVTDLAGLIANCSFNVTVNDIENPEITCPANVVQSTDPGSCDAVVYGLEPLATDNCPGVTYAYTTTGVTPGLVGTGSASGQTFNKGVTTVTYTATDAYGRTDVCSFTITINDTEAPVIECPPLAIYPNTPGACGAIGLVLNQPVVSDNCSDVINITVSNNAPSFYILGSTEVIWTAVDQLGNVSTCLQVVEVIDTEDPTITCPPDVTVFADAGETFATNVELGVPTTNDNCWVATISNDAPAVFNEGQTVVTWTVIDGVFNEATCTQTVTVLPNNQPVYNLGGRLSYMNAGETPLTNSTVQLRTNGSVVATTVTNSNGDYLFNDVQAGTYTVTPAITKPWGGANATDALIVMRHFTQLLELDGLPKIAADVNGNGYINSLDALFVAKRFINQINSFPAGDWASENPLVVLNNNTTIDVSALCMGDVNGSHTPALKMPATVSLNTSGTLYVKSHETVNVPVRTFNQLTTGAVSMVINYPADLFEVSGVAMADRNIDNMIYNVENGTIRIAWYTTSKLTLNPDETLLTLSLRAKDLSSVDNLDLTLDGITEIADETGIVQWVDLTMPKLAVAQQHNSVSIYPNPFRNRTEFSYILTEEAQVNIQVFDMLGNVVSNLVNEKQAANAYTFTYDASSLLPGVYTYKVVFNNGRSEEVKTGPRVN